jgi:hypothetical protein
VGVGVAFPDVPVVEVPVEVGAVLELLVALAVAAEVTPPTAVAPAGAPDDRDDPLHPPNVTARISPPAVTAQRPSISLPSTGGSA